MPCDLLDTKFRSASYKKDAIAQKQDEVSKEGNMKQADLSGRIWRRINPSYIPDDFSTTNQSQQKYDDDDFSPDKVARHAACVRAQDVDGLISLHHLCPRV
eukprot:Rhum_TRINITY_DN12797_c0_g1::Rhum_TRINITY_DN12797_c0_g1_i3::g.54457::m.54457